MERLDTTVDTADLAQLETYPGALPRGEVEGQQLSLEIVTASTDEGDVVAQVAEHLDRVETLLSHQSDEVERWREAFGRAAVRAVADRKTRV